MTILIIIGVICACILGVILGLGLKADRRDAEENRRIYDNEYRYRYPKRGEERL